MFGRQGRVRQRSGSSVEELGWVVEEELADQKGKASAVNCQKANLMPVSRKELTLFPSTV